MRKLVIYFLLLIAFNNANAQSDTTALYQKQKVDVDFLFNYYEQNGEHSAVTGGLGTEELTDASADIIIHVLIDSLQDLDFNVHFNHYTSASTDLIDSRMSSASSEDNRFSFNGSYGFKRTNWKWKHTYGAGVSIESDYISSNLSLGYSRNSKNKMNYYEMGTHLYFDKWVVIYPEEIRGTDRVYSKTDNRNTFQLNLNYQRIISKRVNLSASISPSFQNGLLSTPFHRVYFMEDALPKNEQLPETKFRVPLNFRLNAFMNDDIIIRISKGLYYDDFGITAFHSQIEIPLKSGIAFMFFPFYRYYIQTASDYFSAYKTQSNTTDFFTSDYDLSEFNSHKIGVGTRIKPLYGIGGNKEKTSFSPLKSIELRFSYYVRSDDLSAWMIGSKFDF